MSRLFYADEGRMVTEIGEELTRFRHAKKILALEPDGKPMDLYFAAYAHPGTTPLHIRLNSQPLADVPANPEFNYYAWHQVQIPAELIQQGANKFKFWTDSDGMDSWALAMELGSSYANNFISEDGGKTWGRDRMGYNRLAPAEYLVRSRGSSGSDSPPPEIVFEDYFHLRLEISRSKLPPAALEAASTLEKVRLLSTWVCTRWNWTANCVVYCPWDLETILSWGKDLKGIFGYTPVVMCVHYGVAMVTACQAAGLKARCVVSTTGINSTGGHFTAEVWAPEFEKWIWVDPNLDAMAFDGEVPLSWRETVAHRPHLQDYVVFGEGLQHQLTNPPIRDIVETGYYLQAKWMNYRSVWYRADFYSHPELTPPAHGSSHYCETGLVWEDRAVQDGMGMFPWHAPDSYFDAPPEEM